MRSKVECSRFLIIYHTIPIKINFTLKRIKFTGVENADSLESKKTPSVINVNGYIYLIVSKLIWEIIFAVLIAHANTVLSLEQDNEILNLSHDDRTQVYCK